jgi:hypothetical protein
MSVQLELTVSTEATPPQLDRFACLLDPQWIDDALAATGTASIRHRRLPAEQVIWLVIGLALFRNAPIWHIVQQLGLDQRPDASAPVPSAAIGARQRLGPAPLAWLFNRLASHWTGKPVSCAALFHGLRSFAVDGVIWDVPDTPENRQAYGGGRSQFGAGSWPQVRAACLMDTHTHLIRAACFGHYRIGELSYARQLIAHAPDHSLTIFDRLYFAAAFLLDWQHDGVERHWLMRAKSSLRYELVQTFAPGDWRVRMPVSPQAQQQRPDLPTHWQARLIECHVAGVSRRFLTSLLDPKVYPAQDVVAHYCERWEIELSFREIKQGLLHKAPVLRSKKPELVEQEIWGVLIAYDLIRQEMREMAADLNVAPHRLSFQWLTLAITSALGQWPLQTPGALPKRLALLRKQARLYLLPPRRRQSYPRAVKLRNRSYPIKNASQLN